MAVKLIGILGGISPASTAYYYRTMEGVLSQIVAGDPPPELLIRSLNFERFTDYENRQEFSAYRDYISDGIRSLAQAGACCAIMAANSPHIVLDAVASRSRIPIISIVDAVMNDLSRRRYNRLLLLGIHFTIEQGFYQRRLLDLSIEVVTPGHREQEELDDIIFDGLARYRDSADLRARLLKMISMHNCDAVLLACTELPIVLEGATGIPPIINSARLHVEAAVNFALGRTRSTGS